MAVASRPVARVVRGLEAVPLRTRLLLIVGVLVGSTLLITSMVTAYLLKSDLEGRVDAELRSVLNPVATQAIADLQSRSAQTLPTSYAFVLQTPAGDVSRLPQGQTARPALPSPAAPNAASAPRTPSPSARRNSALRWRFIAAPVADSDAVVAVGRRWNRWRTP